MQLILGQHTYKCIWDLRNTQLTTYYIFLKLSVEPVSSNANEFSSLSVKEKSHFQRIAARRHASFTF